jgi:hypothetical protein
LYDWSAVANLDSALARPGHNRALVDGRFGASQLMSLAQLLRGVLALGAERCSNCGASELKIIAAIP